MGMSIELSLVERHPSERFISSFNFHCRSDSSGGYLERYPDLKSWSMEKYFYQMAKDSPCAVAPQWTYTIHLQSERPPDHWTRMESPAGEPGRIATSLGIEPRLPKLNRNGFEKERPSPRLLQPLEIYYRRDLDIFGY